MPIFVFLFSSVFFNIHIEKIWYLGYQTSSFVSILRTKMKQPLQARSDILSSLGSSLDSSSSAPLPAASSFPVTAEEFYNLGVHYYQSSKKVEAAACFRQALYLDPWAFQARKALDQIGLSPPFWFIIPLECFLILIMCSLSLFIFSFKRWKLFFLLGCLLFSGFFWFYRHLPRDTVVQSSPARSAPHLKAHEVFSVQAGDWLVVKRTSDEKEWSQIKKTGQNAGWVPDVVLFLQQHK